MLTGLTDLFKNYEVYILQIERGKRQVESEVILKVELFAFWYYRNNYCMRT